MKDKILNLLLLLTVGLALFLSLKKSPAAQAPLADAPPLAALPAAAPTAHPLDAYRARRDQERAREQAALLAILQDAAASEEEKSRAREELLSLNERAETELAVEAALAARGDGQSLCAARRGEILVFLGRAVSETEAALLLEVARQSSGLEADHIRISAF